MNQLHSIRTQLTILLTVVITIVYGIVAYFEIEEKATHLDSELHQQINALLIVLVDALAEPLWNFDQAEVERQLGVLVTNADIASASVIESDGTKFAEAASAPEQFRGPKTTISHGSLQDSAPLHGAEQPDHMIKREIRNDSGVLMGWLTVEMSHARIETAHIEIIGDHIRQFLIITLVLAVTIAFAVTSLVRPVIDITEAMGKVADGDLQIAVPATGRRDEIGRMARALGVFKENAQRLQDALDRERELNGLQRQFVAMVSHEFRTPLAVIDGHAQQMLRRLDRTTPERLRKGLDKVRISVVRLTELMESVLNASRLEEGRIDYKPDRCSLTDMLKELCGSYGDLNMDRAIHVDVDQLPAAIVADRNLLRQVFSNLLSNAIKYSPDGHNIWVTGTWQEDRELVISVRDEGLGIPEPELEKLFGRFFRASTSTGIAGSGIGLHLVHHFVDMHDGKVEVESTVDVGTTFTIRLPFVDPGDRVIADAA